MSLSPEIEELLKEKAALEAETRGLDGEQRQLELRVKVLCEKIIQELKKRNFPRRETISRLRAKVDELEAQLEELSASIFLDKANDEVAKTPSDEEQENDKNTIFVASLDEEELREDSKEP